ncbi:helix-turn-helix domain-containing protein [Lactiplantibacillus plantarum]|uniref:helix-turn-helix domain-containing protein n=1 Tax=Lactiplantibacillus plantarum TaxID=1590 RepID=UPI0002BDEC68|nr:helix-turn-helix domain-containing protein [Lactiplantibacillus plantarum]DAM20201.1 MAG TPA: helix-turn-helix domain protein [Caudoviricetes sp.]EMP44874.1 prophage protein 4 [Lactiplantibacillus plantarum UCMA 3037]KIN20963.1 prophage protein 4 [Lactiplantibacillus plantarum]MCG0596562.1 prophage protein 4 [Lactiplantibacillus plantarum]MCG0625222.1 prophage protein 4 [Lactiplantibacillus plantarum]
MNRAEVQWLTYQQVMDELHIGSVNTVYKMINDGLKVTSIGRLKRIERKELDKYLASKTI